MLFICLLFQIWLSACFLHVIEVSTVEEILAQPKSLIYFYAPDCQHCQNFNDDIQYLSSIFNSNPDFQVIKVNGRKNKHLRDLFDIKYYPTLKLYDVAKKQITSFAKERLLDNLQNFVREHAKIDPDLSGIEKTIHEVSTRADIDNLKTQGRSVLIAFVEKQDIAWRNYFYPSHFYHSSAKSHPGIAFAINFIDEEDLEIMKTYHVSNIPSLVLIEDDHIGVHNTLSINPITNNVIGADDVETFLLRFSDQTQGVWFENIDTLAVYSEQLPFVGYMQRKAGMNHVEGIVKHNMLGLEIEEQYRILLDKITL